MFNRNLGDRESTVGLQKLIQPSKIQSTMAEDLLLETLPILLIQSPLTKTYRGTVVQKTKRDRVILRIG